MKFGPTIAKRGLVLNLDAGNGMSYSSGSSMWYDISGYDHHATINVTPTFSNNKLVFDGNSTYMSIPSTATLSSTTPSFIVACSVATGTVFCKGAFGLYWNYGLVGLTGTTFRARNNNGDTLSPTFSPSVSGMNMFAAVYNGSACEFYRNGFFSGTSSVSYSPFATNAQYIRIGCSYNVADTYGDFYNGSLGFIHVYNRILTGAEILQTYNSMKSRFGLT